MVYIMAGVCVAAAPAIYFAMHYTARQVPRPLKPAAPPPRAVPAPAAAATPVPTLPVAAAIAPETIRLFVSQNRKPGRGGARRIVLESRRPAAKVTYSIRDCKGARQDSALASCIISAPARDEERFFGRVFHWRGFPEGADSVKALQTALGLPEPPDGEWGARTRAAWLERALKPRDGTLHISMPGSAAAAVVFEKE